MMRKPEKAGIFVGILVSMLLLTSSANALIIEPSWVEFTGEHNSWQSKTITIINDENRTVNVTIEPSSTIADCYLSRPKVTLPPYSQTNITLGVQLYDNTHGFIFYTYDNQQLNQFILLTPYESNISVDMIPKDPMPGGSIVFLLTPYVSGAGFVYVTKTNAIHHFNITNGLAFVTLSPNDYGDAVAVFQGADYQARKVFKIGEEAVEHTLTLDAPKKIDLGETVAITLLFDDTPLPGVSINVTEPDGDNYIKITDSMGRISINFDKKGTWEFNAEYGNLYAEASVTVRTSSGPSGGQNASITLTIEVPSKVTVGDKKWITLKANNQVVPNTDITVQMPDGSINAYSTNQFGQIQLLFDTAGTYRFVATYQGATTSKEVVAEKKTMEMTVPNKGYVGQYVTILAEPGASIKIEGGSSTITDKISPSGEFRFVPDKPGKYSVHVETSDSVGNAQFSVYEVPVIAIYNKNRELVKQAKKGEEYMICVYDSEDNIIKEIPSLKVKEPTGFTYDVVLTDGQGFWSPEMTGQYVLSIDEQGYYSSASLTVMVTSAGGGAEWINIVAFIAIICILGIAVKYRDKIAKIAEKYNKWRGKEEEETEKEEGAEEEVE